MVSGGLINVKGNWVLKPQFDEIRKLAENEATGFGMLKLKDKQGLINDKGEWVLELQDTSNGFGLGDIYILEKTDLLKVSNQHSKKGVMDRKGNWILKQKFDDIEILDDLIYVKFGDQEGYTTLDGKYLTFTKNELAQEFHSLIERHYPFVCYSKKNKDSEGKVSYQGCVRSDEKCSGTHKKHFGEYPNDLKGS